MWGFGLVMMYRGAVGFKVVWGLFPFCLMCISSGLADEMKYFNYFPLKVLSPDGYRDMPSV